MSDLDDILDEDENDEAKETEAAKDDAPADEAESDTPDGAEDAAEAEDEANQPDADEPDAQDADEKPKGGDSVPLAAFLEAQNKIKAQLDEANKKLADAEAKANEKPDLSGFIRKAPEEIPSVYDDEKGHHAALTQSQEAIVANTRFEISYDSAVRTHGEQKISTALNAFNEAAKSNPALMTAAQSVVNPVAEIVDWYDRETNLARLNETGGFEKLQPIFEAGGLEAYEKALREKITAELAGKTGEAEAEEDASEPTPEKQTKTMPRNFNKGSRGGNQTQPTHTSLSDILPA